jgi:hypothetical protein
MKDVDIQQWTEMSRGGHFPALEEPELLVEDIRLFFPTFTPGVIRGFASG